MVAAPAQESPARAAGKADAPPTPIVIGSWVAAESSEKKQPSEQEDLETAVKVMETVRGRARHAMVNSLNFAMGLAWMGFARVAAGITPVSDPDDGNLGILWLSACIFSALLVPLILWIARQKTTLENRASEASKRNVLTTALQLRVRARSLHTLSTWGFTFLLAAQFNSAASASLPRDPWLWRLLYLFLLFLSVSSVSALVTLLGPSAGGSCCSGDPRLHAAVSDSIISGSGYVVTLGFLEVVSAAFGLDDVSSSEDLGFLALFTAAILIVTSVAVVLLLRFDKSLSDTASALHLSAVATLAEVPDGVLLPAVAATVAGNLRKLVAKVSSLSGVVTLYSLLYVCLMSVDAFKLDGAPTSLYAPLSPLGAAIFIVVAVVAATLGGGLLELALGSVTRRVAQVSRNRVAGPADDMALELLQALSTTTLSTLIESLAWLVGCAVDGFASSLWGELLYSSTDGEGFGEEVQVGVSLVYCLLFSVLTVTVTLFCAPKPLQKS